jgi:hypothetical protein
MLRAPGRGAVLKAGFHTRGKPNPYEDSLCQETNYSSERALAFFRFAGPGVVCSQSRVLTSFLWSGAHLAWLHQTRIEAQSPLGWRVQRTMSVFSAA